MTTTQPPRPDATNPDAYHPDHGTPPVREGAVMEAFENTSAARRADVDEAARAAVARSSGKPQVLPASMRNKKYAITLARVQEVIEDGRSRWERLGDDVETAHIAIDNNMIADIEDEWGSVEGWQEAMNAKQASTMRATLAIVLGRERAEIGVAMLPDQRGEYLSKIGLAFSIANGVDPTQLEQAQLLIVDGMKPEDAFAQVGLEIDEADKT